MARRIREIPPCNNGKTKYSGYNFYLATVDQSFDYWTQQNACTVLREQRRHCATMVWQTRIATGNDATGCTNNTEVQFIWEERRRAHF
jgi:hypothetical protein